MKVRLNEKQLKSLISKNIEEVEDTSSPDNAQPTSGGSPSPSSPSSGPTSSEGGSGYPQVSTWSDVVGKTLTRGVDNQIDDKTKWEDEIKTSRGPDNQLSEQEYDPRGNSSSIAAQKQLEQERYNKKQNEKKLKLKQTTYQLSAPISYFHPNTNTVFLPKVWNGMKTTASYFDYKNGKTPSSIFFGEWKNTTYEDWIDEGKYEDFDSQFPNGSVRSFTVGGIQFRSFCERLEGTKTWKFNWYADKDGKSYNFTNYIKVEDMPDENLVFKEGFWDKWGQLIIQLALSIAVAIATGGESLIVQCMAQLAVQVPFSIKDFAEGHTWSAILSMAICFLPLGGKALGLGTRYNTKVLGQIGTELKTAQTIEEVEQVLIRAEAKGILDNTTKVALSRFFKQTPQEFEKLIGEGLMETFKMGVKEGTIVLEKIPFRQLKWWKHLLIEGGVGLASLGGAQYVDAVNETREQLIAAIKKEVGIGNQKLKTDDEDAADLQKYLELKNKTTQQPQQTVQTTKQKSQNRQQQPQPQQTQPNKLIPIGSDPWTKNN